MSDNRKNRTVRLCGDKILLLMRRKGWTNQVLAGKAEISTATVSLLIRNKHSPLWRTAQMLCDALGAESIEQLLPTGTPIVDANSQINEWIIQEPLTQWITASNQLQFRVWQLKHQHITKLSRGKCYDLVGMSSDDRENCKAHFLRHAEVCNRIQCENVIRNLTTCAEASGDRWWVIDEWIDGVPLSTWHGENKISLAKKQSVALDIATAIASLHLNQIICRELSPDSVIIRTNETAVLTEFELAKLLDGSPTVSTGQWRSDPYRAPEAESDDFDIRVDIYSWARITTELIVGSLPEAGAEKEMLKAHLKKDALDLICRCLSISRRNRPGSINEVIESLSKWSPHE